MADPHHLPRQRHLFTQDYDFTIIVYDSELEEMIGEDGRLHRTYIPTKAYEYAVSRAVLETIPYFRRILAPGFSDTGRESYELLDDDRKAWKIWLQILHGCLNDSSYDVGIDTVWNVLVLADKYSISPRANEAKKWFANWLSYNEPETVDECREALYPCHTFDHAKGFARATKLLAYENAGHITEKKPKGVPAYHLRLDHRIMQQVNAAKGRLKTILHRELYAPIKAMLKDKINHCDHKEKVVWVYLEALTETMAWPVEDLSTKNSIDDFLSRLRRFECEDPHPDGTSSCFRCKGNFERVVTEAVDLTRRYFDGLCLDCLYKSKTGDKDQDYWEMFKTTNHAHGRYDRGCRFRHEEPTCYFSFMASRKDFDEWGFTRDS